MRVMFHMVSTSRGLHSYIVPFVQGYSGHAFPYRGWFQGGILFTVYAWREWRNARQSEQIALITLRSTAMMEGFFLNGKGFTALEISEVCMTNTR